ncbi:cell wall-active antibiotics response protein LiaF, partial [Paenibacillus sp. MCAF20]
TILDLTKAQVAVGETRIHISSFIGDVKVFVPNDYEIGVQVLTSSFIGDVKILDRKEGGMFKHINIQSPSYSDSDKKIKLIVSTFIGDVRVTKVG